MDQPLILSESNIVSRIETKHFLEKHLNLKKFGENCKVLDVGCGDGSVMKMVIDFLGNFELMVGLDKSKKMVEFAKSQNFNERVKFKVGDVGVEEDLEEFCGSFDYVFSSFCLQWLMDQRKTWKNIFNVLKPGGQVFSYYLADCSIYHIYDVQAKSGKWTKYITDIEENLSPYYQMENPEKLLLECLENAGFDVEICEVFDKVYVYPDVEYLKKIVNAVSPFTPKMSKETQQVYLDDFHKIHMELDYVKSNSKPNQEHLTVPYKLFHVIATKPK